MVVFMEGRKERLRIFRLLYCDLERLTLDIPGLVIRRHEDMFFYVYYVCYSKTHKKKGLYQHECTNKKR